jgi:8-oxo-dGTP pyrophosphatase MutT (NUDIX family)
MYKVFFGNRFIEFLSDKDNQQGQNSQSVILCKNKKSFDIAYQEFEKDIQISNLKILSPNPQKLFKHFKKKFKIIRAAGGLVENTKGEILIMKRNGVWDLPKGKLEKNEKKKMGALREVHEECGISNLSIESKIGKSYHTYWIEKTHILKVTYWYKMLYVGQEIPVPQTAEGISEIKWINKEESINMIDLVYPNLRSILETQLKP